MTAVKSRAAPIAKVSVGISHYDLLAEPEWKAKSILIVSPYVEQEFFERVVRELKPATLTVVIDDGCRSEDVKMVLGLAHSPTRVHVALGSARGLVHAKIFHVEWLTSGGQRRYTFVYGSGNATRQAFDGNINSEVMCKVRLTAANHGSILDWAERVLAAAYTGAPDCKITAVRDAWLGDGINIRLPGVTIKHAGNKANNFDLWLQRGRLLASFQPDPGFLRIPVSLRNELPPGEAERIVLNMGFMTQKTKRLSFPYVSTVDAENGNDAPGKWRSKFFVWTQLGFWCSDSCFLVNQHLFRKAGYEGRVENLQILHRLQDETLRDAARSEFVAHVVQLCDAFGSEAATYLEAFDGKVDQEFYKKSFDQRVERDLELAADVEFRDRYLNGCEVIDVPRFRTDAAAWKSFVQSFARQIHLEWLKERPPSFIYQQIYEAMDDVDNDAFDDPNDLMNLLRSKWNVIIEWNNGDEISIGDYIDRYHI